MSFASIMLFYRVIQFLFLVVRQGGGWTTTDSKAMEMHCLIFSIIYLNKRTSNINSISEIAPNVFRMQPYLLSKMKYERCLYAPVLPFLLPLQKYMEAVGRVRLSNLLLIRHYVCAFLFQLYDTFPDAGTVSPMPL